MISRRQFLRSSVFSVTLAALALGVPVAASHGASRAARDSHRWDKHHHLNHYVCTECNLTSMAVEEFQFHCLKMQVIAYGGRQVGFPRASRNLIYWSKQCDLEPWT